MVRACVCVLEIEDAITPKSINKRIFIWLNGNSKQALNERAGKRKQPNRRKTQRTKKAGKQTGVWGLKTEAKPSQYTIERNRCFEIPSSGYANPKSDEKEAGNPLLDTAPVPLCSAPNVITRPWSRDTSLFNTRQLSWRLRPMFNLHADLHFGSVSEINELN